MKELREWSERDLPCARQQVEAAEGDLRKAQDGAEACRRSVAKAENAVRAAGAEISRAIELGALLAEHERQQATAAERHGRAVGDHEGAREELANALEVRSEFDAARQEAELWIVLHDSRATSVCRGAPRASG